MNTELLLKIKEKILNEHEHFDMGSFVSTHQGCNTTMCIAGWAVVLSGLRLDDRTLHVTTPAGAYKGVVEDVAIDLLNLPSRVLDALFFGGCSAPYRPEDSPHFVCGILSLRGARGAAVAALVIDRLIETGEVDWYTAYMDYEAREREYENL